MSTNTPGYGTSPDPARKGQAPDEGWSRPTAWQAGQQSAPTPPAYPADTSWGYGAGGGTGHDGYPASSSPMMSAPEPERAQETPPRPRRRGVPFGVVVLLMIVSLLAGTILGGVGSRYLPGEEQADAVPTTLPTSGSGRPPDSVAGIAESVLPSTVYIEASGGQDATSGTGVVLREDGYLVTNNHVVAAAAEDGTITVGFQDGSEEEAEVVGRTSDYDLAVLRVDRGGLEPLVLADSDGVVVGDPVVAVGAPLGLEGTVTTGIISALNRPVTAGSGQAPTFINALQTDAAINPGNSGGPLVDGNGEVVGINTAIAQASGTGGPAGSIGLGFAIPANQVRRTTEQIIATGEATYPIIGATLDATYDGEGVQVLQGDVDGNEAITADGPADQAGIRPGEVIVSIDGRPVTTPDELIVAIRARAPGDEIVLGVRRGGAVEDVTVTLGEETSD
ncbi:S1C family serine protease [Georgenia alba]|uniref:S1C family serine protease n=1 Tax=Georgenia alba TaxID=2233858 RepID=A0ABW2QAB8_9MICO